MIGAAFAWALGNPYVRSLLVALAIVGGLLAWHKIDKSSAVRRAVTEYVADVELETAREELRWIRLQRDVADRASQRYQEEFEQARADAEAAEQELEHYVSTVDDACIAGTDLIDRLRNR